MEKFKFEKYRDNLAEKIKSEPDHEKRHEILKEARENDGSYLDAKREQHNPEYKEAREWYLANKELFEKEYSFSLNNLDAIKLLSDDNLEDFSKRNINEFMKEYWQEFSFGKKETKDLLKNEKLLGKVFFLPDVDNLSEEFKKQGYQPATLQELVMFLKENSDFSGKDLIALGSTRSASGGDEFSAKVRMEKNGKLYVFEECFNCYHCTQENQKKNYLLGVKKKKEKTE